MIGSNTSAQHPLAYARITAAKKRGAKLITVDPRRTPVATLSDIHLAIRPGSNLALINALMHVILFEEKAQDDAFINERTEHFDALRASLEGCTPEWAAPLTGLQPEAIRETARLYAKGPNSIILYCMGVTQQVTGTRTCGALANLVMLCGMIGRPSTGLIPLRGQNNVQGSCDMGALPETLPGYVKADSELGHQRFARLWGPFADEQGKKLTEIMDGMRDGSIRAAYIMGENPMQSDPDAAKVEAGLRNLDFLIVQDIFMTPTAQLADVILPATSYLEKQGTFTNTERRVQLINEVLSPLPGTRADWRILCDVINALGGRADYDSPREIFNEIRQVVPSYAGMDYTRLAEEQGLCWPCPTPDHPGTPYLHAASFTRGRGLFTVNEEVSLDLGKEIRMHNAPGASAKQEEITVNPIPYESVTLFNTQNGFASFLVPAILILVIQQTLVLGIGMLGGTAREKNRFHSLVPISRHFNGTLRIVLGKSLTYILIYVVVCIWVLAVVPKLFSLPQVGDPVTILLFILPYLFASIFFAMTLSGFMTTREAPMLVFVFTSVILLFISGVSWPKEAIPPFWQAIGYLFPSTPVIQGFIRINTCGAALNEVVHEYHTLWIQAGAYFVLALVIYRFQIIRSRKMIIKQHRYMKMKQTF